MSTDVLENMGYLALGSRLKRLAERLQAGAARAHADGGFPIQPSQFPLLAALDSRGPITVSEAVEALGVSQPAVTRTLAALLEKRLVETQPSEKDHRIKTVQLTVQGRELVGRLKVELWPRIEAAARELIDPRPNDFLAHVVEIENRLKEASLDQRINRQKTRQTLKSIQIVEYTPSLAGHFETISREWVSSMFVLEPHDLDVIENPQREIIDRGGQILFVEAEDLGIIGTCALMPDDQGGLELTKMGVLEAARGLKAGEFLLTAVLERAKAMKTKELYLLTNKKCEAAIHLYEKFGFVHDPDIMARFSHLYERCDVAMSYDLKA